MAASATAVPLGPVDGGLGGWNIGGLVGANAYPTLLTESGITASSASGNVTGGDGSYNIGGLAGYNGGAISASSSVSNVTGGSLSYNIGGLVGKNAYPVLAEGVGITASSASGNVTGGPGSYNLGGLVGLNDAGGNIVQSRASGTVTGGGGGTGITAASAYEALFLATCGGCSQDFGGLVGFNAGRIVEQCEHHGLGRQHGEPSWAASSA